VREDRPFRLDLVVALGALLISTVAALATVYQTRVIARQFSAAVWPYVSFDSTNSPTFTELDIRNDGLGPAIVRAVKLSWDGKPQPSIEAVVASLRSSDPQMTNAIRAAFRSGASMKLTTSTPDAGMVIPANSQHTVLKIEGTALLVRLRPELQRRLGLSICYCSLTGNCWTQSYRNRDSEPTSVRSCT
jgi:hypothetical protein